MLVSVDEGHAIKPLLATPARENLAEVSPNGRWLAYETDETGRNEIFVRPFPDVASARARISQSGGQEPAWSRDGRTLYFRSGAEIMSVDVGAGSPASWGVPRRVFQAPYFVGNSGARQYDVGPDGRFLMIKEGDRASNQIVVVLNWFTELQQRVPTK